MASTVTFGPRAEPSAGLIRAIERGYDIGEVLSYSDLGGAYNLNLRLDTTSGSVVLRVYRTWVTEQRLAAIQATKGRLRDAGVPVAPPLPGLTGASIVAFEQRVAEVEPYVEHDDVDEGWDAYLTAFAFLGQLHQTLADVPQELASPLPVVENYTDLDLLPGLVEETRRRIAGCDPGRGEHRLALRLCRATVELLQPIQSAWRTTRRQLPCQIVHGDFGTGNILLRNAQVVGLIDLEFVAVHERLFDIAYALYWMMARVEPTVPYGRRSWYRVGEMLAAYDAATAMPLTLAERQALPLQMARIPLHWIGEARHVLDAVSAVVACEKHIALASWIAGHAGTIDSAERYGRGRSQ